MLQQAHKFLHGFKGLKFQIILKLLATFFLGWLAFILYLDFNEKEEFYAQQRNQSDYRSSQFESIINESKAALQKIGKQIMSIAFDERIFPSLIGLPIEEKLDKAWYALASDNPSLELQYFNPQLQFTRKWPAPRLNIITNQPNINHLRAILEHVNGISYFSCKESCYYNLGIAAGLSKIDMGVIQLSIPVDSISHQFSNQTGGNIYVLKNITDASLVKDNILTINHRNFEVITHTSKTFLNKIKQQANHILPQKTNFLHYGETEFMVKLIDKFNHNGINFLIVNEINPDKRNSIFSQKKLIFGSLFILIPMIALFNYLLSQSMTKLRLLNNVMSIIGQGDFQNARKSLKEGLTNPITDELDMIHHTTYDLTEKLSILHNHLTKSNNQLQQALDDKRIEHNFTKSILNTAEAAIITCDMQFNITSCNQYAMRILMLKGQLKTIDFFSIFTNPKEKDFPLKKLLKGKVIKKETTFKDENNKLIHLSWSHSLIPKSRGSSEQILSIGIDISQRIQYEQGVLYLADHDSLSRLYNRRKISYLLKKMSEKQTPFALVNIDIDHFKVINDTLGHDCGDDLIKRLSAILLSEVTTIKSQTNAYVGRTGGDEFTLIICTLDQAILNPFLDKIVKRTNHIAKEHDKITHSSISIGLALYPVNSNQLEQLSVYADTAMYEHKKLKQGDYHYYNGNETQLKNKQKLHSWSEYIRESLTKNTISVHFQPLVDKNSHQTVAYEALARLKDRNKDQLQLSSEFIRYAEKTQMITDIDKYIINLTLQQVSQLKNPPTVMINLSNITLTTPNMSDYIIQLINHYHYPKNKIVFEITESSEIADLKQATAFIKKLQSHDIAFALDDFGAGFSSFFYLRVLKVDYLKIDKKIIIGLRKETKDHYIVNAIVTLAKQLGIKTVAEGIENQTTLDIVRKYDIDLLQGYYFSKPKKIDNIHLIETKAL